MVVYDEKYADEIKRQIAEKYQCHVSEIYLTKEEDTGELTAYIIKSDDNFFRFKKYPEQHRTEFDTEVI